MRGGLYAVRLPLLAIPCFGLCLGACAPSFEQAITEDEATISAAPARQVQERREPLDEDIAGEEVEEALDGTRLASEGEGMTVPWRHWQPEGPPKAAILALHGFNDYSNAFQDFAAFARARGVPVHAYDQRGFGANGDAGFWAGTEHMVADLRAAAAELRAIYPETPLYILGESMGGAVTIVTAASGDPPLPVDGLILVAPAVWGGDQLNFFYRATLWLSATIAPGWKLTGSGLEIWPSDNIEMLRAFSADPLVIKGTRTAAIAGLVGLMDAAQASLDRLDQETLILVGEKDEVVPPSAFAAMRERLARREGPAAASCREIIYPEGYHMLLRDLQREVVYHDVMAWLDRQSSNKGDGVEQTPSRHPSSGDICSGDDGAS